MAGVLSGVPALVLAPVRPRRCGTDGPGGMLGLGLARDAATFFFRGKRDKLTSTVVLRTRRGIIPSFSGRRDTNSHLPSFCVCRWCRVQTHITIVFHGRRGTDGCRCAVGLPLSEVVCVIVCDKCVCVSVCEVIVIKFVCVKLCYVREGL